MPDNQITFVKEDFLVPETVRYVCFQGHDITNEVCVVCRKPFKELIEELVNEAGCLMESHKVRTPASPADQRLAGRYYEDVRYEYALKGHTCMSCWEDLPDGRDMP